MALGTGTLDNCTLEVALIPFAPEYAKKHEINVRRGGDRSMI